MQILSPAIKQKTNDEGRDNDVNVQPLCASCLVVYVGNGKPVCSMFISTASHLLIHQTLIGKQAFLAGSGGFCVKFSKLCRLQ